MKKIINLTFITLVIAYVFVLNIQNNNYHAQTVDNDSCINYSFTTFRDDVHEQTKIQFVLNYQLNKSACELYTWTEDTIEIDFGPLIDSNEDIYYSPYQNIFDISITNLGHVKIQVKPQIHDDFSISDLKGTLAFIITVKDVDEDSIVNIKTLTNNSASTIPITILNNEYYQPSNTRYLSTPKRSGVDDVVNYQILINGDEQRINNFRAVAKAVPGAEYIPDSLSITTYDPTRSEKNSSKQLRRACFKIALSDDGDLILENSSPFQVPVVISFDMKITDRRFEYVNDFTATYDTVTNQLWNTSPYDSLINTSFFPIHGNISLTQTDVGGNLIGGAEYNVLNSDNRVVDHLTTDDSAAVQSTDLALGTYSLVQTYAPSTNAIDTEVHTITLDADDADMIFELNISSPIEPVIKGTLSISLKDSANNSLSGAEFDILDNKGKLVTHIKTDEDGAASVGELPLGEYTIVQTSTPEGYVIDETEHSIALTEADKTAHLMLTNLALATSPHLTSINITKTDDNGKTLQGASFKIVDSDGDVVDRVTTNQNGVATTKKLEDGHYQIIETKAPEGYVLDSTPYNVVLGVTPI